MAFFKPRKGGDDTAPAHRQPESIEAMRKRAKHRLIGAAVLVLIGVVGFPLLFDTQPRSIDNDIPIEIPDRNKVTPLPAPVPAPVPAPAKPAVPQASAAPAAATPAPTAPTATAQAPVAAVQPKAEAKAEPKVEATAETKRPPQPKAAESKRVESKPARPEPKHEGKAEPRRDDGARAQALLEGKPVVVSTPAPAEGRFIVQVGAFSDAGKAREVRQKVEKTGLKTYTHIAEGKEGKLIRVRVGPFGTKAEAEKAAEKVKVLNGKAAVLAL